MSILYFAYGSNMDRTAMAVHCRSSRHLGAARLDGFRLAFLRRSVRTGSGVADVVPDPQATVWGVLYELQNGDLEVLDVKESLGRGYSRERMAVTRIEDGTGHDAFVYTVIHKEQAPVQPSSEYLERMIKAAALHEFPKSYLAALTALRLPSGQNSGMPCL